MKTTATRQNVLEAIANVNEAQGYELELNRDDYRNNWYNFTLKTRSKIPGARTSANGRNLAKASWHAHGYVFDEIIKLDPEAVIKSLDKTIDINGGNWQDYNIGSLYFPVLASDTSIL